jgi:hypothetical protein
MFVATVVLSGLLAFVFGAGAAGKLTKMPSEFGKARLASQQRAPHRGHGGQLGVSWPKEAEGSCWNSRWV